MMKIHQTRRELQILRRMVEIENDPNATGELMREGYSWWIDTDRCTRTALTLLLKRLIKASDPPGQCAYAIVTPWGHKALLDPNFISPFVYVSLGLELPPEAQRLMDPGTYGEKPLISKPQISQPPLHGRGTCT